MNEYDSLTFVEYYVFRYIRLWDARKELKRADLPTGCDSYVSSLTFSSYYAASSTSGIFTAGGYIT